MHYFFLFIVLTFHVGYSLTSSDSLRKHGSHNLLRLGKSNDSLQRPPRCTPCENNVKRPVSNHLDPEHRGNGADNLGYDWSSMAWGGPAFPRKSKVYVYGMRGRDGKMMFGDGGRNQGNVQVICDTCRAYRNDGRDRGRAENRGRQLDMEYGGQPGYWQGDKMKSPDVYETRVMSPTVGVLVRPGSRIAYIPSRSGEMYWDGVSGGGTRWDGFSNGISWIGNGIRNAEEWDRSDNEARDGSMLLVRGSDYPGSIGSWNNDKRSSNWGDNSGRGYYFTNGVPNDIDPRWRNRGYASNWHYGQTNQNGWNGSNMKWNYGGKQWPDNDRAANRFYFNSPQDTTNGPQPQYGNQYPNYQSPTRYPASFRPQPSWPIGGGYRPDDRYPTDFQPGNLGDKDKDRPWDYTSRGDTLGHRRPGPRPEWARPGPSYPPPANFVDIYEKNSGSTGGYHKFSPSDKNYQKPWIRPSGYSPSRPGQSGGFPYGGNRYPEEGSGSGVRPTYPSGGGHLFFPNEGNRQPSYSGGSGSGNERPIYSGGSKKPGEYPSYGNQGGSDGRPAAGYPGDKRPAVIYTGGRPSSGGSGISGYPGASSSSGGYPGSGSSSGGYPGSGSSSGGYPGSGSSSGGYPGAGSSSGGYPGAGSSSGGYPGAGSSSGGYPGAGSSSGGYPGAGSSSGGYPGAGSSSGGYPGAGSSSGGYPGAGSSSGGYPGSGSSSGGYPGSGSSSGGYPGSGTLSGDSSGGYPSGGGSSGGYPSSDSASGSYLLTDSFIGGYPSGGYPSGIKPGGHPGSGSSYSSGNRPTGYPSGGSYSGGGSTSDNYYGGGDSFEGYPNRGGSSYLRPGGYPGGSRRPGFYQDQGYPGSGYFEGVRPTGFQDSRRPGGYGGDTNRPDYPTREPPPYPGGGAGGSGGSYSQRGKNPPKGFYTGFITELSPYDGQSQYGGKNPNYFGSSYPGDKNFYPGKDRDKYHNGGSFSSGYPDDKNSYPAYSEDRYSGGYGGDNDRGRDKYYYGQSDGKSKYSGEFPSNHRYPNGGSGNFDRNQGSISDKNSWNYGQNEHKDGIYRRSGGSYPPYKGGQYYTSSYLASMSTTAGSTQAGTEQKTQSMTKADEVTQPTSDST